MNAITAENIISSAVIVKLLVFPFPLSVPFSFAEHHADTDDEAEADDGVPHCVNVQDQAKPPPVGED
jgi:hypothetical protein